MTFRWIKINLTTLIVAFTLSVAAQDLPRQQKPGASTPSSSTQPSPANSDTNANVKPDPQDANHSNNAINTSNNLERSQSAMQKSAPATQPTAEQAEQNLSAQTSPQHELRSSEAGLVWLGVIVAAVVILLAARRPRRRMRVRRYETDIHPAGRTARMFRNREDEDLHRAA